MNHRAVAVHLLLRPSAAILLLVGALGAGAVPTAAAPTAPVAVRPSPVVVHPGRPAAVAPGHPLELPAIAHARAVSPQLEVAPAETAAESRGGAVQLLVAHRPGAPASPTAGASTLGAVPSPTVLQDWQGTSEQSQASSFGADQAQTPPDPSLAVGGPWVVEATNQSLSVLQSTGPPYPDAPGATCPVPAPDTAGDNTLNLEGCNGIDLANFINAPSGWTVSNPRVLYDSGSGQFYLTVFETTTPTGAQSCLPGYGWPAGYTCSVVYVLHTLYGNPTGAWAGYVFLSYYTDVITDEPTLSFSTDKVAVSWNEIDIPEGDAWMGDEYFIMAKSAFLSQAADPVVWPSNGQLRPPDKNWFGLYPLPELTPTSDIWMVANDASLDLPQTPSPGPYSPPSLHVLEFSGTGSAITFGAWDLPMPASCMNLAGCTGTNAADAVALQSDAYGIDTDDDRIQGGVWANGTIFTGFNDVCTPSGDADPRVCIMYLHASTTLSSLNASTAPVTDIFGIDGAYAYYPTFGIDSAGDTFTTFTFSGNGYGPSVAEMGIPNGGDTFSYPQDVAVASGPYFDASACSMTYGCRFGDYGSATMDPSRPGDFWFVDEYQADGTNAADWGTSVGVLTYTAPAISSFSPAAGPSLGGTTVTVTGSDFAPGTTFTFGGDSETVSNLTPYSFTFVTPSGPGGTQVTGMATDSLGSSSSSTEPTYLYVSPGRYQPLAPYRIVDTRTQYCIQCGIGALTGGGNWTFTVAGYPSPGPGVVPSTAVAVVLNVTALSGSIGTYLTVYPAATERPGTSNINLGPGQAMAGLVTVALGGGQVSVYNNSGSTNVLIDVEGYFDPGLTPAGAGTYHALGSPVRACDSRTGVGGCTALRAGAVQQVTLASSTVATGIPTDGTAEAAVFNLTAVSGTAATWLTVYPPSPTTHLCGGPPAVSNLNVVAGADQPNRVIVPVDTESGTVSVCVANANGTVNFLADVNGWFGNGTEPTLGADFYALGPSRICDTRFGQGTECSGQTLGTWGNLAVPVAGIGGLPTSGIKAIVANLTVVNPTALTYLTVYPDGTSYPGTSDVNTLVGGAIANMAIITVPSDGRVDVTNAAGTVDVILDVVGWFE